MKTTPFLLAPLLLLASATTCIRAADHTGDVTDVRVIRHMEWSLVGFIPQPVTGPKVFLHEGNIAPGDFRAVWDSGTKDRARTHIHFGKFRVRATP